MFYDISIISFNKSDIFVFYWIMNEKICFKNKINDGDVHNKSHDNIYENFIFFVIVT